MAWLKKKLFGKKKETITEDQRLSDLRVLSLHATKFSIEQLDELVHVHGKYPSRSEAIRTSIRDLLRKEHPAYVETRKLRIHDKRKISKVEVVKEGLI